MCYDQFETSDFDVFSEVLRSADRFLQQFRSIPQEFSNRSIAADT